MSEHLTNSVPGMVYHLQNMLLFCDWLPRASLFGTFFILCYPIELQEMFFWQKNKYFQKMPTLFWISKKPNWVPAEWYWRLRFENTMRHFVIISWCFDKNFHCVLKSQPSAPFSRTQFGFFEIQNKEGIFWKYLFFCQKNIPWSSMG